MDHGAQGMGRGSWGAGHGSWFMGRKAWVVVHGAQGMGRGSWGAGHGVWFMGRRAWFVVRGSWVLICVCVGGCVCMSVYLCKDLHDTSDACVRLVAGASTQVRMYARPHAYRADLRCKVELDAVARQCEVPGEGANAQS